MLLISITSYTNEDELFVLFVSAVEQIVEKTAHDKHLLSLALSQGQHSTQLLALKSGPREVWRYLCNMGIRIY